MSLCATRGKYLAIYCVNMAPASPLIPSLTRELKFQRLSTLYYTTIRGGCAGHGPLWGSSIGGGPEGQ